MARNSTQISRGMERYGNSREDLRTTISIEASHGRAVRA